MYIFACINPNCWNQNDSWTCLRIQSLEGEIRTDLSDSGKVNVPSTTAWLSEADDWGENMNDNASEQNGNEMLENDALQFNFSFHKGIEQDIREELAVLHMDDPNANRFVSRLILTNYTYIILYVCIYNNNRALCILYFCIIFQSN